MSATTELSVLLKELSQALTNAQEIYQKIRALVPDEEPKKPAKALSLEEVRAVLADKSRCGHTAEIREFLKKYGADRLSAIDPANYQALLEDAEGLNDAS